MTWLDIHEVAECLGCSISTVRRRIRAARLGKSGFPLPRDGPHNSGRWKLEDIESWQEAPPPNVPAFETNAATKRRLEIARKQLKKLFSSND